ncbi:MULTISPECIES: OsmC family protein [unclassified Nocardioides]|uniref:OsmC family protein n=1 Tax=unclassified Nocardioides TaxID=2615069 RepID=UPI0011675BC4|nr:MULTISPECIES: OsmC family protein [unclassified Nocardioides]TQK68621.1 putative OsmC-like protein [Nocardioides sp. SLBN-35]WGY02087.1 OsmC family protein [Nocardioides sp. QY071]
MSAPTEYHVHATTNTDRARVTVGGTDLTVDASWPPGEPGTPGPAELLAAAFATCLLKNLARCRELVGFGYDEAEVEVTARRQDAPPRFVEVRYRLRIVTDEPTRRVDLVHQNLRKFGTVYNTLAAVCDVDGTVEAVGAPASI